MNTIGEDIFKVVNDYMKENNLSWNYCIGICTVGASSMIVSIIGSVNLAKKLNKNIITAHCFLHRQVLVAKIICVEFKLVLEKVLQMVIFIKSKHLSDTYLRNSVKKWGCNIKTYYCTQVGCSVVRMK